MIPSTVPKELQDLTTNGKDADLLCPSNHKSVHVCKARKSAWLFRTLYKFTAESDRVSPINAQIPQEYPTYHGTCNYEWE